MFGNYLAAALRNLQRNGAYAAMTVIGLAIAFASAILIGLYLRHELTYDQFIPGHERVFLVNQVITAPDKPKVDMDDSSAHLAEDMKLEFPQIQYVARLTNSGFPPVIRRGDVSVSEQAFAQADPDFFKIMRMPAVAGDPGTALEASDAIVLTRSMARKFFRQDAPLGGQLLVDGRPVRVAAVIEDLPTNSHLPFEFYISSKAPNSILKMLDEAGYTSTTPDQTYVRLKPGASAAAINRSSCHGFLDRRVVPQHRRENRSRPWHGVRYAMRLKPLASIHLQPADGGDPKPGADVKVLAGIGIIGVLIVVVAAINFVTLMTARASRRAMEVGVRKALGAQRKEPDRPVHGRGPGLWASRWRWCWRWRSRSCCCFRGERRPAAQDELQLPSRTRRCSWSCWASRWSTGLLAGIYPALVLSSFRRLVVGAEAADRSRRPAAASCASVLVVAQFAVLIAAPAGGRHDLSPRPASA